MAVDKWKSGPFLEIVLTFSLLLRIKSAMNVCETAFFQSYSNEIFWLRNGGKVGRSFLITDIEAEID